MEENIFGRKRGQKRRKKITSAFHSLENRDINALTSKFFTLKTGQDLASAILVEKIKKKKKNEPSMRLLCLVYRRKKSEKDILLVTIQRRANEHEYKLRHRENNRLQNLAKISGFTEPEFKKDFILYFNNRSPLRVRAFHEEERDAFLCKILQTFKDYFINFPKMIHLDGVAFLLNESEMGVSGQQGNGGDGDFEGLENDNEFGDDDEVHKFGSKERGGFMSLEEEKTLTDVLNVFQMKIIEGKDSYFLLKKMNDEYQDDMIEDILKIEESWKDVLKQLHKCKTNLNLMDKELNGYIVNLKEISNDCLMMIEHENNLMNVESQNMEVLLKELKKLLKAFKIPKKWKQILKHPKFDDDHQFQKFIMVIQLLTEKIQGISSSQKDDGEKEEQQEQEEKEEENKENTNTENDDKDEDGEEEDENLISIPPFMNDMEVVKRQKLKIQTLLQQVILNQFLIYFKKTCSTLQSKIFHSSSSGTPFGGDDLTTSGEEYSHGDDDDDSNKGFNIDDEEEEIKAVFEYFDFRKFIPLMNCVHPSIFIDQTDLSSASEEQNDRHQHQQQYGSGDEEDEEESYYQRILNEFKVLYVRFIQPIYKALIVQFTYRLKHSVKMNESSKKKKMILLGKNELLGEGEDDKEQQEEDAYSEDEDDDDPSSSSSAINLGSNIKSYRLDVGMSIYIHGMCQLIEKEYSFCNSFFQFQPSSSISTTTATTITKDDELKHENVHLLNEFLDRVLGKSLENRMNFFLHWIPRRCDLFYCLSILYLFKKKLNNYLSHPYISKFLQTSIQTIKMKLIDGFLRVQFSSIERYREQIKKTTVVPFFANFPMFLKTFRRIHEESSYSKEAFDLYSSILKKMFDKLQALSMQNEKHAAVFLMKNYSYFYRVVERENSWFLQKKKKKKNKKKDKKKKKNKSKKQMKKKKKKHDDDDEEKESSEEEEEEEESSEEEEEEEEEVVEEADEEEFLNNPIQIYLDLSKERYQKSLDQYMMNLLNYRKIFREFFSFFNEIELMLKRMDVEDISLQQKFNKRKCEKICEIFSIDNHRNREKRRKFLSECLKRMNKHVGQENVERSSKFSFDISKTFNLYQETWDYFQLFLVKELKKIEKLIQQCYGQSLQLEDRMSLHVKKDLKVITKEGKHFFKGNQNKNKNKKKKQ